MKPNMSDKELYEQGLWNSGTNEGREILFTKDLRNHLSEGALHRNRAKIQVENIISFSKSDLKDRPELNNEHILKLREIVSPENFNSMAVAEYDHFGRQVEDKFVEGCEQDVKSVELYLRERFDQVGLSHLKEWIHFPFTSEDPNNLSWNLMLRGAMNEAWLPTILSVTDNLAVNSEKLIDLPVLGKTHGVNASPTTFGKRFSYSLDQILEVLVDIRDIKLRGKYGGPVGNHNAMAAIEPDFDMRKFARNFVESFGFEYAQNQNQRNSHNSIVKLLHDIKRINTWGQDLCENIRHSIMLNWLALIANPSHTGSTVMPHKVNPWFFEVGEGYLETSNALINGSAEGLLKSVFERDLTDHPWERSYGDMIGRSLIGFKYIDDGLKILEANSDYARKELGITHEILTEAVQIAGRLEGVENIYMKVKEASRGKGINKEILEKIISEHIPKGERKERLKALVPEKYLGYSKEIAKETVANYRVFKTSVENGILDNRKSLDVILFDFDNTLQVGDKDELHFRLEAISNKLKMGFTLGQIISFGNRSDYREMRKLMVEAYNKNNYKKQITEEQFQKINNEVSGQFDEKFKLADGAKDLLSKLKGQGYKLGLVTTRGSNSLPRLLEMHRIEYIFDVIINRDNVIERKPHPQPIALALDKLNVVPLRTMYVGDKQVDDIIAGNSLGMQTVLINGEKLDKYGAKPTYHFGSLEQLDLLFSR